MMRKIVNPWRNPKMEAVLELVVPFHDLDPMEVVWHGNYFKYLEQAREVLLKQLGYGYQQMYESGYMWPVVDAQLKYRHVLTFDQKIAIRAVLLEFENRLKIGYEIRDVQTGQVATTAYTIQVAIDALTRELSFESPAVFRENVLAIIDGGHLPC